MTHFQPTPLPDVAKDLKLLSSVPTVEPGTGRWRALIHRVREARRRLPPQPVDPVPRYVWVVRGSVAVGAVVWIADGVLEALRANVWLSGVPLLIGVISLALCLEIGRTRTDARIRRSDRPNVLLWALVPLSAIGLLFRIAWLLEQGP